MHVEVHTSASAFQTLRAEWGHLLTQMPVAHVFYTPEWQATWWRHFGAQHHLSLFTIRSDDGQLQGLVPLMRSTGDGGLPQMSLLGDLEVCDYLDVLAAPIHAQAVGQAVMDYLVAQGLDHLTVSLPNLSHRSATLDVWQHHLLNAGFKVEVEQIETCPTIDLPTDWDAYLALLRGKDRHELRRKWRRAEAAAHLEYRVTSDAAQLDADVETFVALHRMSQADAKQGFMTAEKEAFFRDMAQQLWSQGWLDLAFLYADGQPIATLCCFTYGTTYAAYNSGYHPGYSDLSAGIVLFADRIRAAIVRRFTAFDFMRGNESYKYRFGATDRPLYRLVARTGCAAQGATL